MLEVGVSAAFAPTAATQDSDEHSDWGAMPLVALVAACGLVTVAVADTMARNNGPYADLGFWLGVALIVVPGFARLMATAPSRAERISLVLVVGLATYLIKVLHSPSYFTLFDEALHVRTAQDIADSGHLFLPNPLLVVSPLFPALEIATTAVSQLSGASTFDAGVVVVGVARVLLVLTLFLLFEQLLGSARSAGIATFIYGANQNFVYFDSQFAYESVALPMALLAILVTLQWQKAGASDLKFGILACLSLAAVVVTHHLTTYVLVAFLSIWVLTSRLFGPPRAWIVPAKSLVVVVSMAVAWVVLVAQEIVRYMAPRVMDALQLFNLILGDTVSRPLFQTSTGLATPLPERIVAIVSIVVILAMLPYGLWRVWRDRRHDAIAIAVALGALGYPASLALRLTAQGAEEATRAPEFVFLGVAFVSTLALTSWSRPALLSLNGFRAAAVAAMAGVVFMGGIIIGIPRWARLPGPYLVAADPRSIEAEGRTSAQWVLEHLGPDRRLATDRVNRNLMGSVGRQYPVTSYGDEVDTWRLFYTPSVDPRDRQIIKAGRVQILVTDQRLTTSLPLTRVYFESGEPHMFDRTVPLDLRYLVKWDNTRGVSRFFDSGDIHMYDVSSIRDAP